MISSVSIFLLQQRSRLSIAALLLILASGCGGAFLELKTHYSVFFDKTDVNLVAHQTLENKFTQADNVFFLIHTVDDDVFTKESLEAIHKLTQESWKLPYSVRVDSITNYHHVTSEDNTLTINPLYNPDAEHTQASLNNIKNIALNQTELLKTFVSKEGKYTGVNVNVSLPYASETAAAEVTYAARELKNHVLSEYPQLDIDIVGQVPFNWVFNEMAMIDGETLFPIMFGLMFLILTYFYRTTAAIVGTLTIISASSIIAFGAGGWFGYSINAVNLVSGIIIMTVAVADCVHILNEYYPAIRAGKGKISALQHSFSINLSPITITSLATAIGFFGLNFSASPVFRELGNITAVGVIAAWALTFILLPFLLLILTSEKSIKNVMINKGNRFSQGWIETKLPQYIKNTKSSYLVTTLAIVIIAIACVPLNKLDERVLTYFDEDVPFRAAVEKVQDKMLGFDRIAFSFDTHQSYGINDPLFLSQTASFVDWARSQPEVTQVVSYTDTLKNINRVMKGNQTGSYSLPATSEEAGQLLLTYELSLPFGADLNHVINHQKEALRISIGLTSQSANTLIDFENRAQIWIKENIADHYHISPGASVSMMFAHLGENNINSMITGNMIVTILVTLTLIIILGSLKFGLLTLLPNVVPALMTFGIWGVFVGEINMAVAVVFCITLGIVVDDTVHFTSKYLYGRRKLNLSPVAAMEFSYARVGKALLITTITLVTGFLVLCFSSLKVNSAMGILVASTIFIAFVFDLFVFPRLLVLVDSKGNISVKNDQKNLSKTDLANG